MKIHFESEHVIVSSNLSATDIVVFSFSPWTKNPPAPPFGYDFITKNGLQGVFFQSKANDWWNNPSMTKAIVTANGLATGARCRIAFGSSMGAYGALVHGPALKSTNYIAISPQASIEQSIVPWETRWREEAKTLTPNPLVGGSAVQEGALVQLIYDPMYAADRQHAELISTMALNRGVEVRHLKFALSGHPSGQALAETKQLSAIITDLFHDRLDYAREKKKFHLLRRNSRAVALFLLTNRSIMEAHPILVARAISFMSLHQTFDDKIGYLFRQFNDIRLRKQSS